MGRTCEVLLDFDDAGTVDAIDAVLASAADHLDRTRRARVWDAWVRGRPVHLHVAGSPPVLVLAAGCNGYEDYEVLRSLANAIVRVVGGVASEPEK